MPITEKHIDKAYAELKATCGGVRQDYFGLLYLERECELPRPKAVNQVAFGGNDYGIDAFHINPDLRNLYLFQFKWSSSAMLFKDSFQRLINAGMAQIFGSGAGRDASANPMLLQLKSRLMEYESAIDQVFIYFVFNGDPNEAERSQVLDKLREDLEGKKFLIDQYFERPIKLAIQFRSAARGVGAPIRQKVTHTYPITVTETLRQDGPNGEQMLVGFVPLTDLHGIYRDMGARFFERNIRYGLEGDEAPNRAIARALRDLVLESDDDIDTSVFAFNHNGVTIYAQKLERLDGQYRITEPRLLNGAQTVTTLDRFLVKNEGNVRLKERRSALERITVLCKFITNATEQFIVSVTINNNRQNPVMPWDLHANDLIQLQLQDRFRDKLSIYYQRQENAFANLTQDDLDDLDIVEQKPVEMLRLAQTFMAADGELDKMIRLREVFEDEKLYGQVFNDGRLRADLRQVTMCYKVQFRLRRLIREIMTRGETKYAYMAHARNLVWALLCQAILNGPDMAAKAEAYGTTMILDADFTNWLATLSSSKVRFLIRDVIQTYYEDRVRDERYDFLRTNAVYEKCMAMAGSKWSWTKKRLK